MKDIKVLIDTNVILDWIMVREPNASNARMIMEQCLFGQVQGFVTSHSLTDLFYILRKDYSVEKRKQLLRLLCEGMNVVPETRQTIMQALNRRECQDIEDALQMQCAKEAKADYIITQNLKDFRTSEVKVICEEEFCKMISAD